MNTVLSHLSDEHLVSVVTAMPELTQLEAELFKRFGQSFMPDAQAYLLNQAAENGIDTGDKVEELFRLYEASNHGFDSNLASVLEFLTAHDLRTVDSLQALVNLKG